MSLPTVILRHQPKNLVFLRQWMRSFTEPALSQANVFRMTKKVFLQSHFTLTNVKRGTLIIHSILDMINRNFLSGFVEDNTYNINLPTLIIFIFMFSDVYLAKFFKFRLLA